MTTITPVALPLEIPGEVRVVTTREIAAGTATDAEVGAWRVAVMLERLERFTAALASGHTSPERMAYLSLSVASWSLIIAREAVEADGGTYGIQHKRINDAGAVVTMAQEPDADDNVTLTWGHVVRERSTPNR